MSSVDQLKQESVEAEYELMRKLELYTVDQIR